MPSTEVTGKRPTTFSVWHRAKLPKWCCWADADCLEVRHGHVVAFCEIIQVNHKDFLEAGKWITQDPWLRCWYPQYDNRYPLWDTKRVILNYFIGMTKLRVFVIYHTPDMRRIRVIDYRKKRILEFDEQSFADWLMML